VIRLPGRLGRINPAHADFSGRAGPAVARSRRSTSWALARRGAAAQSSRFLASVRPVWVSRRFSRPSLSMLVFHLRSPRPGLSW